MSSAHSMNARKCVHAQKPYPSQAVAHGIKQGPRKRKKRDRKDRGQEADNISCPGNFSWTEQLTLFHTFLEGVRGGPGRAQGPLGATEAPPLGLTVLLWAPSRVLI